MPTDLLLVPFVKSEREKPQVKKAESRKALERKLATDIVSTVLELRNLGWTDYQIQREIAGMLKSEVDDLKAVSHNFPFYTLIIGIMIGSLTVAVAFQSIF